MIEREGVDRGVEPGVDGVEHRARHRHAVMAFEHRRRVGEHHRDGVAALDAALAQRRGEPPRAGIEVAIIAPQRAVDDGDVVGIDRGRALQELQRRQRLEIRRVAVEIDIVGRFRHCCCLPLGEISPLEFVKLRRHLDQTFHFRFDARGNDLKFGHLGFEK